MKKYTDGIIAFFMWAAVAALAAVMFIEMGGI